MSQRIKDRTHDNTKDSLVCCAWLGWMYLAWRQCEGTGSKGSTHFLRGAPTLWHLQGTQDAAQPEYKWQAGVAAGRTPAYIYFLSYLSEEAPGWVNRVWGGSRKLS